MNQIAETIMRTCAAFKCPLEYLDTFPGPTVTRYEFRPADGVRVNKVKNLAPDIEVAVGAKVRMEAPIPGKAAIGIEIPNSKRDTVLWESLMDNGAVINRMKLPLALGKDIAGMPVYHDLAKLPHLLIAGTTGSGKSVCMNSIIFSLMFGVAVKGMVRFIMIDPKMVELSVYKGIPELLCPPITTAKGACSKLKEVVADMEARYNDFIAPSGMRDIDGYNSVNPDRPLYRTVVFIDELSDLMMQSPKETEDAILRIAQKGRAAGIHLVIATQRPTTDVITGTIKANLPGRIALSLPSATDSRTVIGKAGAETLLGNGDMLFSVNGGGDMIRVQGCFISDADTLEAIEMAK